METLRERLEGMKDSTRILDVLRSAEKLEVYRLANEVEGFNMRLFDTEAAYDDALSALADKLGPPIKLEEIPAWMRTKPVEETPAVQPLEGFKWQDSDWPDWMDKLVARLPEWIRPRVQTFMLTLEPKEVAALAITFGLVRKFLFDKDPEKKMVEEVQIDKPVEKPKSLKEKAQEGLQALDKLTGLKK